jgi:lambda family phage minor tail protein L
MSDLFLLRNSEIIDLFEIKINDFEGYFRFHGSKNFNKDLIFKGAVYLYIPCELSNLEYSSEGKQNRPVLSISNINNFISNFIKDRNDLLGCRFFRKKILAKDLDDVNFGGVYKNTMGENFSSSFASFISNDTYIIQKKNVEQKDKVDFLLANVLDIDGLVVPSRKIFNDACQWQYRGCGCNYGKINGYDGPSVAIQKFPYTDLTQIPSYSTDLVAWFKDGVSQTISGTSVLSISTNPLTEIVYPKLTAWTDSSGLATLTLATLSGSPKVFTNTAGKTGILFDVTDSMTIGLDFTLAGGSNTDCTIFYVSAMKDIRKRGADYKKRGLSQATNTFNLGYWKTYEDNHFYADQIEINLNEVNKTTDKDRVYAATIPKTQLTTNTVFYRDGNEITRKPTPGPANLKNFGINLFAADKSEIIVYEIIVYRRILTDDQVKFVSSYLANKYKTPIAYTSTTTDYKNSVAFFDSFPDDGNLGVPMADENNKIFLESQQQISFTNYETYKLNNLNYKGDYDNNTEYIKGDFVKLDPSLNYDFNEKSISSNSDLPAKFFVCVENTVKGQNPLYNTKVWKEDKCSKNLNGCLLRFGNSNVNIPFGGFPGTVGYDYRLPG